MTPFWPPRAPKLRLVKPKPIPYELIVRDHELGGPVYTLLDAVIAFDEFLPIVEAKARIALAWVNNWRRNRYGKLTLGKCRKASDLEKEFAPFDFGLLLNRNYWFDPQLGTPLNREALLHHELMHCGIVYDEKGHVKEDERGRAVFDLRPHDIEEHGATVQRYGLYKADLQEFAAIVLKARRILHTLAIGPSAVHAQLQLAGITSLSLERIAQWDGSEQRAVMEWALVRADRRTTPFLVARGDAAALPTPGVLDEALAELIPLDARAHLGDGDGAAREAQG